MQLGRYPAPKRVIAHVSDLHLLADGALLGGVVDTDAALVQLGRRLAELGDDVDAIVVTGDIADLGEADAYHRARSTLQPVADRASAELIWIMGNHDEAPQFGDVLWGAEAGCSDGASHRYHRSIDLDGLRILVLDSTVLGYHHGAIDEHAADWLAEQLSTPAPDGSILALHHAPIPSPVALMDVLELRGQDALAEVVRDSDVRMILGGHLHYATQGRFAGIPVSVAGAIAYTIDPLSPRALRGTEAGRSFSLVHVGSDSITTSFVPLWPDPAVSGFDESLLESLETLDSNARTERFSRKPPRRGEYD